MNMKEFAVTKKSDKKYQCKIANKMTNQNPKEQSYKYYTNMLLEKEEKELQNMKKKNSSKSVQKRNYG